MTPRKKTADRPSPQTRKDRARTRRCCLSTRNTLPSGRCLVSGGKPTGIERDDWHTGAGPPSSFNTDDHGRPPGGKSFDYRDGLLQPDIRSRQDRDTTSTRAQLLEGGALLDEIGESASSRDPETTNEIDDEGRANGTRQSKWRHSRQHRIG